MNPLPIFLVGLMGSIHCIGMCGGIVGALSAAAPRQNPGAASFVPSPVSSLSVLPGRIISIRSVPSLHGSVATREFTRVACYNLGRLSSYAAAGALAGAISAGLLRGADVLGWLAPAQRLAYAAANLMLVLLGLYLTQWWTALARIESLGNGLWARVRPLAAGLIPVDTPLKALALGSLWGWLPCGMVYSALLTAMMAGSAAQGALTMLAFGVGTLPVLMALGLWGARLRRAAARPAWRRVAGIVVLAFGVLGLLRAAEVGGMGIARDWLAVLCVSPVHGGQP